MGLGYLGESTEAPLRLTQQPLPARAIGFGIGAVAAFLVLGELHHPLQRQVL